MSIRILKWRVEEIRFGGSPWKIEVLSMLLYVRSSYLHSDKMYLQEAIVHAKIYNLVVHVFLTRTLIWYSV